MDELLKKEIESTFKNVLAIIPEENRMIVTVQKEQVLAILDFLKDRGYDHLGLISCVDWLKEKEFELTYFLNRYQEKEYIILKTRISREKPEFITAIPIFKNAEPYEREIHELFGIKFAGHPRLTHLFLERDYKIPPFRKDFDTRKYVEETFGKIPDIENRQD